MKICTKCKTSNPLFSFSKNKNTKDGFTVWCKTCTSEYKKIYRALNKEDIRKALQENYHKNLEARKEYRQKNQTRRTAQERTRKASKLKRTPAWLTDFDKLHMECLYQVAAMRTRESGYAWHVDHVIPLQGKAVSGLHVPSNLRVIPATENLRKNNSYVS